MKTLSTIVEYWPIIIFFLGLSFHVIWTYFRVGSHDDKLKDHHDRLGGLEKATDVFREGLMVDIKGIKTSIEYIEKSISEIKQKN